MDGNYSSILFLVGMTGLIFMQNQACQTTPSNGVSFEESDVVSNMLSDVGPNVILPSLQQFGTELDALGEALEEFQATLANDDSSDASGSAKLTVQTQWKTTMNIWQQLELMQVGPAGSSLQFIAGQDLRDEIYSWPTTNGCRVDQKTADMSWQDDSYFSENLVNAYGLDALEHLLFADVDSVCPSQVDPIANGSWAELGSAGIERNRVAFALILVEELQFRTEELIALWVSEEGNFSDLLSVSTEASPYESRAEALNQVYNALFYLETMTKDKKLAIPLGYNDCATNICPERLEGTISQRSLESIVANIKGFELLFTGGEGVGFDDVLIELGHGDLARQVIADIEATVALTDNLTLPLDTTLETDVEQVEALYDSLALVTTALKVDMSTILQVEIPEEASGDND